MVNSSTVALKSPTISNKVAEFVPSIKRVQRSNMKPKFTPEVILNLDDSEEEN